MSKQFENILDECLEGVLVRGESIEQCLNRYPEQAGELEPLLRVALQSRAIRDVYPHPEFKAKARYQFRAALEGKKGVKARRFVLVWLPRWATVVTLVLGFLLIAGGTVTAAGYSMPDSPLYPLKVAAEDVQVQLTPSSEAKAELCIEQANRRVEEIVYMANKGDDNKVEALARKLHGRLEKLAELVSTGKEAVPAPAIMATPAPTTAPTVAAPAPAAVATPAPAPVPTTTPSPAPPRMQVPDKSKEDGKESSRGPEDVPKWAGKSEEESEARAKLRMAVADNAVNHPAVLQAMLDQVPESSRPALRETIRILIEDYNKALRALD